MAQLVLTAAGSAIAGPVGGYLGNMLGSYIDSALFGSTQRLPDQIGAKLDNLKVQSSAYGQMIPQVFGSFRIGGNVIWSQDIKETEVRETTTVSGGGKGGGGQKTSQTSVTYNYTVTLAIAVCEGEIEDITGVWADSKKLDARTLESGIGKYEVHLGSDTQDPSSIIESYQSIGGTPAYRGVAYVVIEDFPLADYGNRIPNFTFEVKRPVRPQPAVEDLVKDIVIIPGSGEFVYSTTIAEKFAVELDANDSPNQSGKREKINMHNFDDTANVNVAVDQMLKTFPNLEWVAIIVNWFITSKDMATGTVIPKVEFSSLQADVTPTQWRVGNITRDNAQIVKVFSDGRVTYGGTPSDHSILELCTRLKQEGLKVLFYPMPLVDTTGEELGEDAKPWRGRLVPASASECTSWFTRTDGYNAFIRHYSQLSGLAAQIDAFVIGTELRGITTYDAGSNNYPGVTELRNLAASVRSDMPTMPITYAADWSEYHSTGGYYHLDSLWSDPNITFIGIDNYMPLTPDLDQTDITQARIKEGWENGEGWDYFYADSVNRTGKTSYVPDDGQSPYAWKNIEQFWNSSHFHFGNISNPSGWTPKMKPVWFTEYGFPSVDGAANQPNVFVDPTSVESFYPRGSKRRVDYLAQRDAVAATLDFWQSKNAQAGNDELVPHMFLWTWDARPYPFFPDLLDVWADGNNWRTGHWVTGKFGISGLGAIIADLLKQVGYEPSDYDVSTLTDPVEGFVIENRATVRSHIELLRSLYFFDVAESDGMLKFIKRGNTSIITIPEADIVPQQNGDVSVTASITRKQELDLPRQIDITFINRPSGFLSTTQTAQRQVTDAIDKIGVSAPIVMSDAEGRRRAEQSLYATWVARNYLEFTLPPKYATIDASDVVTLTVGNVSHQVRVVSSQYGRAGIQKMKALTEDVSAYDFYVEPGQATPNPVQGVLLSDTRLELLDLPLFPGEPDTIGNLRMGIAGTGEDWRGAVIYRSFDGGESGGNSFSVIASGNSEAILGNVLSIIPSRQSNTWDNESQIDLSIINGSLQSVNELALLNGANACLCGNEIIQFQTATLVSANKYRLSRLLRGRLGTEHQIDNHVAGERFIFLDSAIIEQDMATSAFGLLRHYKPVSVGATLAATDELGFTYQGNKFKPYSPVHLTAQRDGSGNITVSWIRRTRLDGQWRDGIDVPLGEESERYEVDIIDGSDVVRTINSNTSTVIYQATDQVADFGTLQVSIDVRIYQVSAVIGRGTAAEANL